MGPSLRDADWIYGSSPANIYSSISEGRAKGMPAWGAAGARTARSGSSSPIYIRSAPMTSPRGRVNDVEAERAMIDSSLYCAFASRFSLRYRRLRTPGAGAEDRDAGRNDLRALHAARTIRPVNSAKAGACDKLPTADELKRLLAEQSQQGGSRGIVQRPHGMGRHRRSGGRRCARSSWPPTIQQRPGPAAAPRDGKGVHRECIQHRRAADVYRPAVYVFAAGPFAMGSRQWQIRLNPACLGRPGDTRAIGKICGGTIAFGGGVAALPRPDARRRSGRERRYRVCRPRNREAHSRRRRPESGQRPRHRRHPIRKGRRRDAVRAPAVPQYLARRQEDRRRSARRRLADNRID